MAPANPKTHKDITVPRVPRKAIRMIEQEAKRESITEGALIRRIILRHCGLLNGQLPAR